MQKLIGFVAPFDVRRVGEAYVVVDNEGHPVVGTDTEYGPAVAEFFSDLLDRAANELGGYIIIAADYN